MRNDAKRATVAKNPPRIAEIRAQDMYENDYVVDCCVFCSYPPPHRPPMRAKFRAASSFFVRDFLPSFSHLVLRIFEPDLLGHKSPSSADV